jgi:uncharacterized protein
MAQGLPDRVDCARLAEDGAVLERVYPQGAMPRLCDVLADARGSVAASFAFAKLSTGRPGATVAVKANVLLTCQRCLQGFAFPVAAHSEVEFADSEETQSQSEDSEETQSQSEVYAASNGLVSLRELAEEELLLALPIVAKCSAPETCGRAPIHAVAARDSSGDRSRPFAVLQDLLKKT